MRVQYRWVMFQIAGSGKEVVIEAAAPPASTWDDFVAAVPESQCRYGGASPERCLVRCLEAGLALKTTCTVPRGQELAQQMCTSATMQTSLRLVYPDRAQPAMHTLASSGSVCLRQAVAACVLSSACTIT